MTGWGKIDIVFDPRVKEIRDRIKLLNEDNDALQDQIREVIVEAVGFDLEAAISDIEDAITEGADSPLTPQELAKLQAELAKLQAELAKLQAALEKPTEN